MNKIFAAGDWHGDTEWAYRAIKFAANSGGSTLIQLGDFGIWPEPGGPKYVRKVNTACEKNNIDLIVVPGNHENYDRLDKLDVDADGWLVNPEWHRIKFAPRGHVWQLHNGMWAAALGGAGSIDKNTREPHKSWWEQEAITMDNVDTLIKNMAAKDIKAVDVMFTHECPAGIARPELSGNKPVWVTPDVEAYCNNQRVLLRYAMDAATPSALYHGHWHQWFADLVDGVSRSTYAEYNAWVFGLSMNGMPEGHMVEIEWSEVRRGSVETSKLTVK